MGNYSKREQRRQGITEAGASRKLPGKHAAQTELRAEIEKGFDGGMGENIDIEEFIRRAKSRWKKQ